MSQAIMAFTAGGWTDTIARTKLVSWGRSHPLLPAEWEWLCTHQHRLRDPPRLRPQAALWNRYVYFANPDSGTNQFYEPQQIQPSTNAAKLRSASRYYRNPVLYCEPKWHPIGVRYVPTSDARNTLFGQSTFDIGWYSTGSHWIDWGFHGGPDQYTECDDPSYPPLYDKLVIVGVNKEYP